MRGSRKNGERGEQVRKSDRKPAKVEPLRPQAEQPNKLYNDLAKFPSENPYPVLRIHRNGTVLYANKASEGLLKARSSGMGQPAPAQWRRLVENVLASGRVAREEVMDNGRVFALRAVPIVDSDYVNFYGVDITEQKKAEKNLQDIIDKNPMSIQIVDKDGFTLSVNSAHTKLFGSIPPPDYSVFNDPQLKQHGYGELIERIKNGEVVNFPDTPYNAHDSISYLPDVPVWVHAVAFPINDSNGKPERFVFMHEDITERKRAEEAMRISDTRFRELFNRMSSGVAVYEAIDNGGDFIFRDFNPAAEKIEKVSRKDIIGKRVTEVFPGVKTFGVFEVFQRVWQTGKPEYFPQNVYRDERILESWRESWVLKLPTGEIVVIYNDITERKRAETELHIALEKYRVLFESFPLGISVTDAEGNLLETNRESERLLDISRDKHTRRKYDGPEWRIVRPDGTPMPPDEYASVRALKEKRLVENVDMGIVKSGGAITWISVTAAPIPIEGYGVAITYGDVTERKRAEQKLLEYQKQLKHLAAQLALTEERERRRIAGELHDQVTQSLALAKIKLDTLHAAVSSQPLAQALEDISGSMEKAIQDTRSLTFDLSNPILYELGFEAAVAEWLNEQVRDKHGIGTEFQDDGQPKPLDDDVRMLLFRNVRELLINVIKYANADKVKVRIRRIDGSIEVTVKDNGIGFDPIEARSMAAKRTEFGLFSVRESLEELGGRFEIESKPGAGCKATMTAPLKGEGRKKEE